MMLEVWTYSLVSVIIVSLIAFVGLLTLSIKADKLKKFLLYTISFSAGALFGDAFLHLLPELIESGNFGVNTSLLILLGIVLFFVLEKFVHWQHCHMPITEKHTHPLAVTNLVGDGVHNLIDGLIIGASYMVSLPVGIATTIAVALHEIPQEIGDFGILLHAGFSKSKALFVNFLMALTSIIGVVIALVGSRYVEHIELFLVPIAIGGFIYVAGSDLIPELHKEFRVKKALLELIAFVVGVLVMYGLLFLE